MRKGKLLERSASELLIHQGFCKLICKYTLILAARIVLTPLLFIHPNEDLINMLRLLLTLVLITACVYCTSISLKQFELFRGKQNGELKQIIIRNEELQNSFVITPVVDCLLYYSKCSIDTDILYFKVFVANKLGILTSFSRYQKTI